MLIPVALGLLMNNFQVADPSTVFLIDFCDQMVLFQKSSCDRSGRCKGQQTLKKNIQVLVTSLF